MAEPHGQGRSASRRRRWLVPVLVVAATAVVAPAVLAGGEGEEPRSGRLTRLNEDAPVRQRSTAPRDRDPDGVTVALRRLDPCAVVDPDAARRQGLTTVVPAGPHSCLLTGEVGEVGEVTVVVGARSDQTSRYRGAPVALGGAKAYRYAAGASCRLVVPVSAVRAIELRATSAGDPCPALHALAEGAVARLRDPDALAFPDTTRPFSAWDGCALLRAALDETAHRFAYAPAERGDPLSGCVAGTEDEERASVELSYGAATSGGTSRAVTVTDEGTRCAARWDHGPTGGQDPRFAATPVTVSATDCATAAALAGRVIALAAEVPPVRAPPQRPLLFGPDDNDTATLGACVDLLVPGEARDCEPYRAAPVPAAPRDIMATSNVDRHVQCAVFDEAVAAVFGPGFAPVTWDTYCFFVDADHAVRIRVDVDPEHRPADRGVDAEQWTDRAVTRVAGRPAVTYWSTDRTVYGVDLSPYGDANRPGILHLAVEAMGGRGGETAAVPPLPHDRAELGTAVLVRVVRTYFP